MLGYGSCSLFVLEDEQGHIRLAWHSYCWMFSVELILCFSVLKCLTVGVVKNNLWSVNNHVWSHSHSFIFFFTAACCSPDGSEFAVLALLSCPDGEASTQQDGVILLFDAESSNPIASWSVKKVYPNSHLSNWLSSQLVWRTEFALGPSSILRFILVYC